MPNYSLRYYITKSQVPLSGDCLVAKSSGIWNPLNVAGVGTASYQCTPIDKVSICSHSALICAPPTFPKCAEGDMSGYWDVLTPGAADTTFATPYMSPRKNVGHAVVIEDNVSGTIQCANIWDPLDPSCVNQNAGSSSRSTSSSTGSSGNSGNGNSAIASSGLNSISKNTATYGLLMLMSTVMLSL